MGEGRNVYRDVQDRAVIRTEDVYQMATEVGVDGYSETLLAVVAIAANTVLIKPQLERLGTLVVMGWYYIIGLAVTARDKNGKTESPVNAHRR